VPGRKFFKRLVAIQFLTALTWALLSVVFPLLLKQKFGSDQAVSLLFSLFYLVSLVTFLGAVGLIKKLHQRRSFDIALIVTPAILLLLGLATSNVEIIILYSLGTVLFNIYVFNLTSYLARLLPKDILTEQNSKLGAIQNAAWVVGPLLGGLIAAKFGDPTVFYAAMVVSLTAFLALPIFGMPRAPVSEATSNPFSNLAEFFKVRFRVQAFINGLGLEFIYGSWFLLTLYLYDQKLSLTKIGLITAIASLPWIILEIPIGKIAGKKISEPRLFQIGYGIIAVMMILMGLVKNVWIFSGFYFLAVVGSCFIEQISTPFFIKQIKPTDGHLLSVFLTKAPIARLIAPLCASLLLTFLPLNLVISVFGIVTILFFVNALLLPKN